MFQKIALFSGLSETDLITLRARAQSKIYQRNTIVISQGDETNSLYIIESGRVKIYISDEEGREFILGTLEDGDYFGELALLDKGRRSASVMTLDPCHFWIISSSDFLQWVDGRTEILMNIIKELIKRIRLLDTDIANLALLDVYGRVARILLQRAELIDEKRVVDRLTHQDIANMVGASREMVTRILKDLRQGGYIEIEGRKIILKGAYQIIGRELIIYSGCG